MSRRCAPIPVRWAVILLAAAAPACERAEPHPSEAGEAVEEGVEATPAPDVEPAEMRDAPAAEPERAPAEVPATPGVEDELHAAQVEGVRAADAPSASDPTESAPVAGSAAPAPAPPETPAAAAPAEEAAAVLDLESLETKLRETRALGVFTKLALKNDIDDFLADVRSFHERRVGELAQLRERFETLLMKVMNLLQDKERELAEEIARSREAIWSLLADPREFARLEGK